MSNLSPDTSAFDIFADDDSPDTGQMPSASSTQGPISPISPTSSSVSDFDRTMLDDTQPAGFHQQRQSAFDGQPTQVLPRYDDPNSRPSVIATGDVYAGHPVGVPQQVPEGYYLARIPDVPKPGIVYRNNGKVLQEVIDPEPFVVRSWDGTLEITQDAVIITHPDTGHDPAKAHRVDYVRMPLQSVCAVDIIESDDTDSSDDDTVAVWFDVMLPDGSHTVHPESVKAAKKDMYTFLLTDRNANITAERICNEVNGHIHGERTPMSPDDMPVVMASSVPVWLWVVIGVVITGLLGFTVWSASMLFKVDGALQHNDGTVSSLNAQIEDEHKRIDMLSQENSDLKNQLNTANNTAKQAQDELKNAKTQTDKTNAVMSAIKTYVSQHPYTSRQALQDGVSGLVGDNKNIVGTVIDSMGIDFGANAVVKALQYRNDNPSWSNSQISDALVNNDKFTSDQASNAVNMLPVSQSSSSNSYNYGDDTGSSSQGYLDNGSSGNNGRRSVDSDSLNGLWHSLNQ